MERREKERGVSKDIGERGAHSRETICAGLGIACPTSTSSSSASASRDGSTPHTGGIFDDSATFATELERVDNITDIALATFQRHYGNSEITKDAIFDYVYWVLHAPAYRERFANDLRNSPVANSGWTTHDRLPSDRGRHIRERKTVDHAEAELIVAVSGSLCAFQAQRRLTCRVILA